MRLSSSVLACLSLITSTLGAQTTSSPSPEPQWTIKHEPNRCALRGQCGKQSFFGGELPCPDNDPALPPSAIARKKLVEICGEQWAEGEVENTCCDEAQIDALRTNLKRAESIISSCPACKVNFFNLFCTFTCSPDQSLFVNVTSLGKSTSGKEVVTELDNLWTDEYGKGFYNSCKDVKFGATGGKAMDFIGGGAKNYSSFLKFLGDKKPFGSPFQINFPIEARTKADFPGMDFKQSKAEPCNSTDSNLRCACVDCDSTCPELAPLDTRRACHVGVLPCLSFAVILVYSIGLALLVGIIAARKVYQRQQERFRQRLQLLQDSSLSDDEDDDADMFAPVVSPLPLQRRYRLNTWCDKAFHNVGKMSSRYPLITIGLTSLVIGMLSLGWVSFEVETNPVRLWVSPDSPAALEKQYFDDHFGPFYRAEQVFLVNDSNIDENGQVLSYDTLSWWFDVESRVQRMLSPKAQANLNDVCFSPTGKACVIQSLTGYFQGSLGNVDTDHWQEQLSHCAGQPGSQECLPEFQQPLEKDLILGGLQDGDPLTAQAIVVTWVLNNYEEGSEKELIAIDWEIGLRAILQNAQREAQEKGLRLSYSTEMSLESELNKSTNTDAKIVVISYIIMFIYASIALGSTTLSIRSIMQNPPAALVQSKFSIGVIGIIIVLLSVSASVGLFSACGIKVTLIIAEVIPFLILAIGVDNIFLIVHEFERLNVSRPDDSIENKMARTLGRVGPSILLSALTETAAFALGAAVGMPAVRNFAIYAAGAVVINALLQVTMFAAVLSLNQRRVEDCRADCFPLIQIPSAAPRIQLSAGSYGFDDEGVLRQFIRNVYAPALMKRKVKLVVVSLFLGVFTAGLALLPTIPLGLDQRIAFPDGSHLIEYFNDLDNYFNAGPPVYFVVRNIEVEKREHQQELCGRFSTCHSFSLTNVLEQEAKRSDLAYLSGSTASWIDDFFTWLNPTNEACCVDDNGQTCFLGRTPAWNVTLSGMPEGEEFLGYLNKWIQSPTTEECPFGGQAPYSAAIDFSKGLSNESATAISASHFRTSHTPLRSQDDFISAYASARRITDNISRDQGIDVFPYSKFYIFFDQYATIWSLTALLLGSGLGIVLVLTAILLGSVTTAAVLTLTVGMILVDIMGVMALAGVSLNAISLVNLVISLGIAVEFCAHLARSYMFPSSSTLLDLRRKNRLASLIDSDTDDGLGTKHTRTSATFSNNEVAKEYDDAAIGGEKSRTVRATAALMTVGPSIFSGIFCTKVVGVAVLAFTRSKIFEIYYFRIWLALVILAGFHALVWLPIMLSICGAGGLGYAVESGDGAGIGEDAAGLEEDLRRRSYRGGIVGSYYDDSGD